MFGQNLPQNRFGPRNLGRVELTLHRQAYLFLFKPVENIRGADRVVSLIDDLADGGPFANEDIQHYAFFRIFALNPQVFEIARIPERVKIALDGDGVVCIARMRKKPGQDSLLGDTTITNDADLIDRLGDLSHRRACRKSHQQHQQKSREPSRNSPRAGDESVLDLHRAAILRRAQVLVRSIVILHAKNMHTLNA